jgi:hypothetical protein
MAKYCHEDFRITAGWSSVTEYRGKRQGYSNTVVSRVAEYLVRRILNSVKKYSRILDMRTHSIEQKEDKVLGRSWKNIGLGEGIIMGR